MGPYVLTKPPPQVLSPLNSLIPGYIWLRWVIQINPTEFYPFWSNLQHWKRPTTSIQATQSGKCCIFRQLFGMFKYTHVPLSTHNFKEPHFNVTYTDGRNPRDSKYEARKSFCKFMKLFWTSFEPFEVKNKIFSGNRWRFMAMYEVSPRCSRRRQVWRKEFELSRTQWTKIHSRFLSFRWFTNVDTSESNSGQWIHRF